MQPQGGGEVRPPRARRTAGVSIWSQASVHGPALGIEIMAIFQTFLALAGPLLFHFVGYVPLLPALGVWPSFAAILSVGHWGPSFALGIGIESTKSVAFATLCALLYLGIVGLDLYNIANVGWWIYDYFLGLLPDAAAVGTTLTGAIVVGAAMIFILLFDVLALKNFLQIIARVNAYRARAERQRAWEEVPDNGD